MQRNLVRLKKQSIGFEFYIVILNAATTPLDNTSRSDSYFDSIQTRIRLLFGPSVIGYRKETSILGYCQETSMLFVQCRMSKQKGGTTLRRDAIHSHYESHSIVRTL